MACRRNDSDRLLQRYYREHGLALVAPRPGRSAGDAFIGKHDDEVFEVTLADLFDPPPPTFDVKEVDGGHLDESFTGNLDVNASVGFLHGIAAAFGLAGKARLKAAYGSAAAMRLRARSVKRKILSMGELSRYLREATLKRDQTLMAAEDPLYVVVEIWLAASVEVIAKDHAGGDLTVDAQATGLADATASFKAGHDGGRSLVYSAHEPAAFGLRLARVVPDGPGWSAKGWRLESAPTAPAVRGSEGHEQLPPPAVIGDPEGGDLFLRLKVPV